MRMNYPHCDQQNTLLYLDRVRIVVNRTEEIDGPSGNNLCLIFPHIYYSCLLYLAFLAV